MAKANRGGKSAKSYIKKVESSKDFGEMEKALSNKGIKVANSLKNQQDLKINEVSQAFAGALEVLEEFGATSQLSTFNVWSDGVMSAGFSDININPRYFKNGARDLKDVMNSGTFHPANQTAKSTGAHEAGHILDHYIQVKTGINGRWETYASPRIVNQAMKELKAEYRAKGLKPPTMDSLKMGISGYALKNTHETFAEAIADVYANGNKANEFSVKIYQQAKKTLGIK